MYVTYIYACVRTDVQICTTTDIDVRNKNGKTSAYVHICSYEYTYMVSAIQMTNI